MLPDGIAPEGVKTSGKDEDFEKNICYIIKLEQPKNGTKLKVVGEDGKALTKSFDFDVAKEGEKVYLDATLKEGYRITGAFNGDGDKIPLLKDEDGRYYIVVPKGGGVYLSVEQSNRYTVTLKDKNGTILQSTEVTYGTPISNLKDPVKAGKVFLGWYTDAALKNKLDPNAKITSDMQLYAKWGTASYPVSGGAKIVWKKGSGVNPTITINRKPDNKNCFKHFVALRIDGKLLRMGKDFFGKSGSTILTLQADMLETLALGNHTVTVEFDDGQVETALSIVAADSGKKSPKTGDAAQNGVWMMLAMLTAFGVAGVVLKKKTTDC
ncbi:MAG: InlB B-repeat-containing protein [Clostridia bacterium]|nr:InlB B-repeat-containing protein [Clostridia bacterium]